MSLNVVSCSPACITLPSASLQHVVDWWFTGSMELPSVSLQHVVECCFMQPWLHKTAIGELATCHWMLFYAAHRWVYNMSLIVVLCSPGCIKLPSVSLQHVIECWFMQPWLHKTAIGEFATCRWMMFYAALAAQNGHRWVCNMSLNVVLCGPGCIKLPSVSLQHVIECCFMWPWLHKTAIDEFTICHWMLFYVALAA